MESDKAWMRIGATVVACGLALAAGWKIYRHAATPFLQLQAENRSAISDIRARVEDARKAIAEMRTLEQDADRAQHDLKRIESDLPLGSAAVQLPALLKEHFVRSGIATALIRQNKIEAQSDIAGCERGFWSVALPVEEAGRNITTILLAVADLDQQKPFVRVLDFAIRPDPENPGRLLGTLNVAGIARKQDSP